MNRLMKFFDNLRLREKFLGILLLAMILAGYALHAADSVRRL